MDSHDRRDVKGGTRREASGRRGNQFAVHFTFDVTPKATGLPVTLEEVGVYTGKGDPITREQFFYTGGR